MADWRRTAHRQRKFSAVRGTASCSEIRRNHSPTQQPRVARGDETTRASVYPIPAQHPARRGTPHGTGSHIIARCARRELTPSDRRRSRGRGTGRLETAAPRGGAVALARGRWHLPARSPDLSRLPTPSAPARRIPSAWVNTQARARLCSCARARANASWHPERGGIPRDAVGRPRYATLPIRVGPHGLG